MNWVKKKSGPPAVTIATKEDAEALLANEVAIVGFFKVCFFFLFSSGCANS